MGKMKQCAVIALVLVGCMEVSLRPAPQPFLLNFLINHAAERRNGKSVSNDGYGVPPIKDEYSAPEVKDSYAVPEVKDGYGAPEISTSSTYEAPKAPSYTTTIAPCSYQAPTTADPSYDAPAPKKHIFGDILGFIGNLIKPKKQETSSNNCLTAPQDSSYGAPQDTSYSAPEESSYNAPEESSYEAPEANSYEAPEESSYEAPEESSYNAPEESSYSAPETPVYNAPEEGSATYEAPESSYNEPEIAINERGNLLE